MRARQVEKRQLHSRNNSKNLGLNFVPIVTLPLSRDAAIHLARERHMDEEKQADLNFTQKV